MYYTIRRDSDGFRARLFGGNHELVWWSEAYGSKASAENAIRIAKTSSNAPVFDRT